MENLSGGQGFLLLHQHLRRMDWSKITPGVTQPEYLILTALHCSRDAHPDVPGVYVSSLAEELSVSVSMISKLLKLLEEKDWVLRTIDKNSRRNTFVSLTPLGQSVYDDASELLRRFHEGVVESIGREKFSQLLASATTLFRAYETALSELSPLQSEK